VIPYTFTNKDDVVRKGYKVRGCVESVSFGKNKGRITIETLVETVPNHLAEFFGVYEVQQDGTANVEHWLADFMYFDDAQMFALEKEKDVV